MIRTRIAPSPTGEDIHIGNLYTALINYAVAKKASGKFIIRIEDTDRTRFQKGAEARILASLTDYGIVYDEGPDKGGPYAPYRQSERLDIYKKYALELVAKRAAYYCFCSRERLDEVRKKQQEEKKTPRYDKYCLHHVKDAEERIAKSEPYVIRLNVLPDKKMWFDDLIRGQITISSNEVDDQVLLKSDGYPTYHLGVVVDDHLMKITHIIRAEEWISSTPKHVLLYESFGWEQPVFAHVPILRNPDKSKLSKRKNPVWARWYLDEGYLPEAVLNYLALMGWSHPEEKEIFSLSEFVQAFDLKDVNTVGPVFDIQKLTWMNQQYIQNLPDEDLLMRLQEYYKDASWFDKELAKKLLPLVKTRMERLSDFEQLTKHFVKDPEVQARNETEQQIKDALKGKFAEKDWTSESILTAMKEVLQDHNVRMPVLYYLLTGEEKGLPLPESLVVLGKDRTLSRLQ